MKEIAILQQTKMFRNNIAKLGLHNPEIENASSLPQGYKVYEFSFESSYNAVDICVVKNQNGSQALGVTINKIPVGYVKETEHYLGLLKDGKIEKISASISGGRYFNVGGGNGADEYTIKLNMEIKQPEIIGFENVDFEPESTSKKITFDENDIPTKENILPESSSKPLVKNVGRDINSDDDDEKDKGYYLKWDIIAGICLFFTPLYPIAMIIIWKKKVPKRKFIRIVATVVFGIIYLFSIFSFLSNIGKASKRAADTNNNKVIIETNVDDSNVSSTKSDTIQKTENNNASKKNTKVYSFNETVKLKNGTLTMLSYETGMGNDFVHPKDGNEYVFVEFEFENDTDKEETISSILSFLGYADKYSVDQSWSASPPSGKDTMDGSLPANMKLKGMVAFEAPKNWKEFDVYFRDEFWSDTEVHFHFER